VNVIAPISVMLMTKIMSMYLGRSVEYDEDQMKEKNWPAEIENL
jgi:hypothetical protein